MISYKNSEKKKICKRCHSHLQKEEYSLPRLKSLFTRDDTKFKINKKTMVTPRKFTLVNDPMFSRPSAVESEQSVEKLKTEIRNIRESLFRTVHQKAQAKQPLILSLNRQPDNFSKQVYSFRRRLKTESHRFQVLPEEENNSWRAETQQNQLLEQQICPLPFKIEEINSLRSHRQMLHCSTNSQPKNIGNKVIQEHLPQQAEEVNRGQIIDQQMNVSLTQKEKEMSSLRKRMNKKFKCCINVALFTIYLRRFNEKMRLHRRIYFDSFMKNQLTSKLVEIKRKVIEDQRYFFEMIIKKSHVNFLLLQSDSQSVRDEKIASTVKLVRLFLDTMTRCLRDANERLMLTDTAYFLCKHGSYACLQPLFTREQMKMMSISRKNGYISANRELEKANILRLIFIKIVLFNVLLQPEKIDLPSHSQDHAVVCSNIRLVGNIVYELIIEINDQLVQEGQVGYEMNNWETLQEFLALRMAKSMTLRQGFFKKDELISGLHDYQYIHRIYCTGSMVAEKESLVTLLKELHYSIVSFHKKLRRRHCRT